LICVVYFKRDEREMQADKLVAEVFQPSRRSYQTATPLAAGLARLRRAAGLINRKTS
jgi:hypothetical protein